MLNLHKLLENKLIVLIGGAGLLGQAFAKGLLTHGGRVVIADISISRSRTAAETILTFLPEASLYLEKVDITSKTEIDEMIVRIVKAYGPIDAVVNNAYPRNSNYGRKLEEVEFDDFCQNVNLHLGGYFLSTQRFARYFKSQGFGHVVNISSIYGVVSPRFDIYDGTNITMPVEYAAIKSAIQHLSKYFTSYYKGTSLRFNVLSPGGILDGQSDAFIKQYSKYASSKGMLNPVDLVGSLVFLLSDLSLFVNGLNLIVDDGWTT
jgi:NAD(P)-dependent dehydrogenase (short-subunit alcohol dehydrogenase family)